MTFRLSGWALPALYLISTVASAGTVRGTLHVPGATSPSAAAHNPYPGRANSMPGMHESPRGLPSDAVIYIERIPAAVESAMAAPADHPQLAQLDQSFVPRVLAVAVGTTIDFPNRDPIYHNVFSVSPIKRFDLGKYPRGHFRSVTFDRRGLVNVYCDIHADMAAFVLVLANHAFARPAADGSWALPTLPPGRYTLHVWHPDLAEFKREIELPAQGDLTLDLSY